MAGHIDVALFGDHVRPSSRAELTLLARIPSDELLDLLRGHGWTPLLVQGSEPDSMHQAMAATLDHCVEAIRGAQAEARRTGVAARVRWPMIVLRAPKGRTAPSWTATSSRVRGGRIRSRSPA